jgi:hypothetical protein
MKNVYSAEIHHQLVSVFGEGVINEMNVHKWWEGQIYTMKNDLDEKQN